MASAPPPEDALNAYDEAEWGTEDSASTTVSAPGSIKEKVVDWGKVTQHVITTSEVVPVSHATPSPSRPPAKKVSKWILWTLWFNMYRSVSIMSACLLVVFLILLPVPLSRKLFTFVVTLNAVGIVLAASGHFTYALRWTSAMALGNLNVAILVRNEFFGRILYLFVNTCFAKVTISIF
jgi:hypothetical protein